MQELTHLSGDENHYAELIHAETSTTAAAAKDKSRNPAAKRTIPRFACKVGEGATRPTARAKKLSSLSVSLHLTEPPQTNGSCIEIS